MVTNLQRNLLPLSSSEVGGAVSSVTSVTSLAILPFSYIGFILLVVLNTLHWYVKTPVPAYFSYI
jgi:hypothetical protein